MVGEDRTESHMSRDRQYMNPAAREFLDNWIATMDAALDEWRRRYLPEGFSFDFTLDSLDELEDLLLRHYPDDSAVNAEDNSELTEGAVRYLGETLRRNVPSRWGYQDLGDDSPSPDNRTPVIRSNTEPEFLQSVSPVRRLRFLARKRRPETLRKSIVLLNNAVESEQQANR